MAWIIQSISQGPIIINDLGLMLTYNQTRDIDLVGRENSERSNDIKYFLAKGMIKTIRKDAFTPSGGIDPAVVQQLTQNSQDIKQATENLGKLEASVEQANQAAKLAQQAAGQIQQDMEAQKKQNQNILDMSQQVLDVVRKFAEDHPVEIRKMKDAIDNIKIERTVISEKKEALENSDMSEAEINTQEKILNLKDKRLEKNIKEIGKKIIKSEDSKDIANAISELEDLGV
jgi:DNA repair exonuclease SbcCD ATPase subunit